MKRYWYEDWLESRREEKTQRLLVTAAIIRQPRGSGKLSVTWRGQVFDMADRITVAEAAEVLGITRDAVYKRVERNKIRHERDADGQLYVYVEQSETSQRQDVKSESSTLTSALEARIESLERQLEAERGSSAELRRLLAAALERIPPQLEAPERPPEFPETATKEEAEPRPQSGERVSWWRRMFGG